MIEDTDKAADRISPHGAASCEVPPTVLADAAWEFGIQRTRLWQARPGPDRQDKDAIMTNGNLHDGNSAANGHLNGMSANGNGAAADTPADGDIGQPVLGPEGAQITINAQYVRDLSFENPRAPHSLMQQQASPEVNVEVDVRAGALQQDLYEVVLALKISAKHAEEPVFIVELQYAGIGTIRAGSPELLTHLVLVEMPRLLFPYARAIISEATRDGGFPPLLLNPIDFVELLRRRQAAEAAAANAPAIV